ncbi:hypothetical protein PR003_g25770 [Phytophthora rubi]|uniref:RNase H type-1 domain-containing protein n=1 Tax=Phytophthora rubi TaxID=129364 RepID=A0A6A4CFC7_9STRA|nr:hypothetical protein PR001_g24289 [Phytophthora rubi]KAE9288573.1 hypothetical protein PR003_g25770 [Phytophthora rubi]
MLTPGGHRPPIRYETTAKDHRYLHRHLTVGNRATGLTMGDSTQAEAPTIRTHAELVAAMQTEVGVGVRISEVHPHPLLARMVCLWAGHRRSNMTRKIYNAILLKPNVDKDVTLRTKRLAKWKYLNEAAAVGLEALSWTRVRRIVGLNPWGEQLLLRVKLHASSTYNPVSAGLDCPHPGCANSCRVDLFHIFWECPAAQELRAVLLTRWRVAGLRLGNYETAIFGLTLPGLPQRLTMATGRVMAELPDALVEEIDEHVDKMIGQCWSLGAALYLLAVWRWRVSHFDAQNDVFKEYHVACLTTRLRNGHRDVTRDFGPTLPPSTMLQLGDCICRTFGADWDEQEGHPARQGHHYVIAVAGNIGGTPRKGYSSVVVSRVHLATGTHQIQYAWSGEFAGAHLTVIQATQLGLLRGLRRCWRHNWGPVHVMADNEDMLRQHTTGTPPKGKHLRGAYWKARRMADAVAVMSWMPQMREFNRTAHELVRLTLTTERGMEWMASEMPEACTRWAAIKGFPAPRHTTMGSSLPKIDLSGGRGGHGVTPTGNRAWRGQGDGRLTRR